MKNPYPFSIQSGLNSDSLRCDWSYAGFLAVIPASMINRSSIVLRFVTFTLTFHHWEIRFPFHFYLLYSLLMKIHIIFLSFLIFNKRKMNNICHSAESEEFQEILTCNSVFHFLCEICHTVNMPGFLPSPLIQFLENIASDLLLQR